MLAVCGLVVTSLVGGLLPDLLGAGATPAMAQLAPARTPPRSKTDLQYSYSPIVKKAAPAVVNVYVSRRVREAARRSPTIPSFASSSGASSACRCS